MKKSLYFILFGLLFSFTAFSQQNGSLSAINTGTFNSAEARLNFISNLNLNQVDPSSATQNLQNEILIQQIGDYNRVFSQVQSESSQLGLIQNGNFNTISLEVDAPTINTNVIQNGDGNTVLDNIYYSNLDVNMNAIQNGNNLSLNRIGVNSLSNKLQIVQEGNFKTVTVISN